MVSKNDVFFNNFQEFEFQTENICDRTLVSEKRLIESLNIDNLDVQIKDILNERN